MLHPVRRLLLLAALAVVLLMAPTIASGDSTVNVGEARGQAPTVDTSEKPTAQKFEFQAEVSRLMDIIINSLYSNREVFLRELISNASDALDKIRFLGLSNPKRLENELAPNLDIRLRANPDSRTLEVIDTGIGMTRDELIKNLGTIAKSGTSAFLKKATEAKDSSNLIGQFGVGFYSAYLVADHVTVTSKHDDDKQYVWESGAAQTFTIYEDVDGEPIGRGTKLTLHLKEDAAEFVNENTLKELITKYSQFINFPIYLETTENIEVEIKDDEAAEDDKKDSSDEIDTDAERRDDETKGDEAKGDESVEDAEKKDDEAKGDESVEDVEKEDEAASSTADEGDDIKVEDDDSKDEEENKPKTRTEQRKSWSLVNENKPIWTRDPSEVSDEEYDKFFEGIAKLPGKPIGKTHFKGEGDIEFKSILYIPERPPVGLYSGNVDEEKNAIRLYVRRVLVTDNFEFGLVPRYLGFLIGIVDSDDIPINVSREMLQQSKTLDVIKRKLVRKALEMIKNLMKEADEDEDSEDDGEKKDDEKKDDDEKDFDEKKDAEDDDGEKKKKKKSKYIDFWTKFSKSMKLGVVEDKPNRARLAKLLRFRTSKTDVDDAYDWASLDEYMERMKEDQDYIYYHSGADVETVKDSPFMEKLVSKGYEVIYLTEPIDEHMIQQLPDYEGTKFMSISKDNFKFGSKDQEAEDVKNKALKKRFKPLTKLLKERLGEKVSKVKLSSRLSQTACVVSTDQYGYSARMEIIMKAQAFADPDSFSYMTPKAKIMELNPFHPIVKEMLAMTEQGDSEDKVAELGHLVYDTALISSGYLMQDNSEYAKRMYKWIGDNVGVDSSAPVVEEVVEEEEEELSMGSSEKPKDNVEDASEPGVDSVDELDEDSDGGDAADSHDEL